MAPGLGGRVAETDLRENALRIRYQQAGFAATAIADNHKLLRVSRRRRGRRQSRGGRVGRRRGNRRGRVHAGGCGAGDGCELWCFFPFSFFFFFFYFFLSSFFLLFCRKDGGESEVLGRWNGHS